ncbi:MAG: hypothetical protein AB1485_09375, partial [Candidatus Thermoplasmatota archaeon]
MLAFVYVIAKRREKYAYTEGKRGKKEGEKERLYTGCIQQRGAVYRETLLLYTGVVYRVFTGAFLYTGGVYMSKPISFRISEKDFN